MEYTVIDLERWPRREFYEHYMRAVPCTYSMTVRLDITNIRRRGYRLYPALLWQLTCAVDRLRALPHGPARGGAGVLPADAPLLYGVPRWERQLFQPLDGARGELAAVPAPV